MGKDYEYAAPRSGRPSLKRKAKDFSVVEINYTQGAQNLAAAVVKLAVEDYLTRPKGCDAHDTAEHFFLDEEQCGFYADLCPAVTRDVERMRQKVTFDRLNSALDKLRRDRAIVDAVLSNLKETFKEVQKRWIESIGETDDQRDA